MPKLKMSSVKAVTMKLPHNDRQLIRLSDNDVFYKCAVSTVRFDSNVLVHCQKCNRLQFQFIRQSWGLAAFVACGHCDGKQLADHLTAACCSPGEETSHSPSSIILLGWGTEHFLTPGVWPLSSVLRWHIHGLHSNTHAQRLDFTSVTHISKHALTHICECILAQVHVFCLSLVLLFFSAPGPLWSLYS